MGVLGDMDDHDLGALLDASMPARPASDAALTRIHRRAARRRRRAAALGGTLTVAVVIALVFGLSALGPTRRTSGFLIESPPLATGPCPTDSITLTIDPHGVTIGTTTRWTITGTVRTDVTCRTHGLDADIETPDGKVLTGIPGNPALQNDIFEDLFTPSRPEYVDDLSWTAPCSTGPVVLVVRYHDGMSGSGARLNLPQQRCFGVLTGSFAITRKNVTP